MTINVAYCPDHTGGRVVSAGAVELPVTHFHATGSAHVCKILLAVVEDYAPGGDVDAWHAALKATLGGLFDLAGSAPADDLHDAAHVRKGEVDLTTVAQIYEGYPHSGKTFSLSLAAQSYWTNLYQARAIFTATGAFPMRVNTLDDDTHDIADEAEVVAMYQAALGTVKAHRASGTAIKDEIRAITNDVGQPDVPPNYHALDAAVAAVEAVADSR